MNFSISRRLDNISEIGALRAELDELIGGGGSGTALPTPSTTVKRDGNGDTAVNNLTAASITASSGTLQLIGTAVSCSNAPGSGNELTNKTYVDAAVASGVSGVTGTSMATVNTLFKRDGTGSGAVVGLGVLQISGLTNVNSASVDFGSANGSIVLSSTTATPSILMTPIDGTSTSTLGATAGLVLSGTTVSCSNVPASGNELTNKTYVDGAISTAVAAAEADNVTLTGTQTLTNKTLTAPVIASISNGGTVTIPSGTDTLVNLTSNQTLTNKALLTPVMSQIYVGGQILQFPTIAAGDYLVTRKSVDTLTNKTITDLTNNVRADSIRNGSTWNVAFTGATPTTSQLLGYVGSGSVGFVDPDVPNATVLGKVLTGYASGAGTVAATDNILQFANKTGGNIASLVTAVGAPTSLNTASQIVKRDVLGNFAAGTIAANLNGVASDVANASVIAKVLTGFTSGAGAVSSLDSVLSAAQKLDGNVVALTTVVGAPTNLNNASQIVKRDAGGNFSASNVTANLIGNADTVTVIPTLTGEATSVGNAITLTNASVIGKVLTGFTAAPGSISASDSILSSIQKLRGIVNTTIAASAAATNSALVLRDASGGGTFTTLTGTRGTLTNNLHMSNQAVNKVIALFDNGIITDQTRHDFYGFGINTNAMRFQLAGLTDDYVFNAATSSTASNEVFRVKGTGYVTSQNTIGCGLGTCSVPTAQGAFIGWNRAGAGANGRTAFMNQQGLGAGGFEFVNYNNVNALTGTLTTIDVNGNMTLNGMLTQGASAYTTLSGSWSGGISIAGTVRLYQVGKQVTMAVYPVAATSASTANAVFSVVIPAALRPDTAAYGTVAGFLTPAVVTNNGLPVMGNLGVDPSGTVGQIYINLVGTSGWSSGTLCGWTTGITTTWITA